MERRIVKAQSLEQALVMLKEEVDSRERAESSSAFCIEVELFGVTVTICIG